MRIFRTIFLLTGVVVLMPTPPPGASLQSGGDGQGLLLTAVETFSDLAGFCARQPTACSTAAYVAGKLEAKAAYGMNLAYRWAGAAAESAATTASQDGQSTLRADDLIPAWRKPATAKKG